jgi:hypothetical protein
MTLIQVDGRTTTIHHPEERTARITVDREIVQPGRVWNGVRINDLSSLWPYGELRTRLMHAAKKWIADEVKRDRDLLTAEADILVFGPYQSRAGTYTTPDALKQAMATQRTGVIGYDESEDFNEAAADFVFKAQFISRRHRPVHTKREA